MSAPTDPYDHLTGLYLTDDGDDPPTAAERVRAEIELIVVGHLPVRAALWLTPYADAVGRERGTTALIRLDGEPPAIEVLRARGELPPLESCLDLPAAIRAVAPSVRRWVVRPPARADMRELLAAGADRITLLSSANEAAITNSYQLVKALVAAGRERGQPLPSLGLAIIGADRETAAAAAAGVDETARSFLEASVPLVLCLPRMDAGIQVSELRTFPGQARPTLTEVVAGIEAARSGRPEHQDVPPAAAIFGGTTAELTGLAAAPDPPEHPQPPASRPAPPEPPPRRSPPWPGAAREAATEPPVRPSAASAAVPGARSAGTIRLTPKARVDLEPKDAGRINEPHHDDGRPVPLADHVPGLTPIEPRCPDHERIELAVDGQGRMHLLGREETLREMPVVQRWAVAHRELLAMACPDQRFAPGEAVVCHVFASEPIRIADLHGSDFRLHVLAPVEVDGRQGWYTAPLN